ncbi:hypothetical protein ACIBQ6_21465 [Nonomuraea sp. NPDC049655]|uniref:hypothetical protein n=1 Tax=Nonomuraea sp. NPDC049655 TaxID=3364355 RepID=UPI0037955B05
MIALQELYHAAPGYSFERISRLIKESDLPDSVSHERIRQILSGHRGFPRWLTVETLVRTLAKISSPTRDPDHEAERFRTLWLRAEEHLGSVRSESSEALEVTDKRPSENGPESVERPKSDVPKNRLVAAKEQKSLEQNQKIELRKAAIMMGIDELVATIESLREEDSSSFQYIIEAIGKYRSIPKLLHLLKALHGRISEPYVGVVLKYACTRPTFEVASLLDLIKKDGKPLQASSLLHIIALHMPPGWHAGFLEDIHETNREEAKELIQLIIIYRPDHHHTWIANSKQYIWEHLRSTE